MLDWSLPEDGNPLTEQSYVVQGYVTEQTSPRSVAWRVFNILSSRNNNNDNDSIALIRELRMFKQTVSLLQWNMKEHILIFINQHSCFCDFVLNNQFYEIKYWNCLHCWSVNDLKHKYRR